MFNKIVKLFAGKPRPLMMGGVGCCEVVDRLDRVVGKLYFKRPNSQQKIDYIYDVENVANNQSKLKELGKTDNPSRNSYNYVIYELCVPYAEEIFEKAEGYRLEGGKEFIDLLPREKQLEYLKQYYMHNLIDMVVQAYAIEERVKKKY